MPRKQDEKQRSNKNDQRCTTRLTRLVGLSTHFKRL
jgi:hypothetical protein